jgi:hypothetical protein
VGKIPKEVLSNSEKVLPNSEKLIGHLGYSVHTRLAQLTLQLINKQSNTINLPQIAS